MKKILLLSLVLILSISSYSFWGFGRGRGEYSRFRESKEVTEYINTLEKKYSVDEGDLSPDKLNDLELEKLGKLLMQSHVVNDEQLKFMQSRMGGENSRDLKDSYKFMAFNYLSGYGVMGNNGSRMWGRKGFFGRFCFGRGGQGFNNGNIYSGDSALEILKKRYANGKITKKEYNEMKNILEKE